MKKNIIIIALAALCLASCYHNAKRSQHELAEIIKKDFLHNNLSDSAKKEIFAEAEAAAKKIANPKTADDFFLKASSVDWNTDIDKAIEYYKKAIELKPDYATYLYIGNVYMSKDIDKAIEYFNEAIKLEPSQTEAYRYMGLTYSWYKEDIDKAIEYYNKAIEINPKDIWTYNAMGAFVYDHRKNYDKAIEIYKKAIEAAPDDANIYQIYYSIEASYRAKNDYDEAQEWHKKAIELKPKL